MCAKRKEAKCLLPVCVCVFSIALEIGVLLFEYPALDVGLLSPRNKTPLFTASKATKLGILEQLEYVVSKYTICPGCITAAKPSRQPRRSSSKAKRRLMVYVWKVSDLTNNGR